MSGTKKFARALAALRREQRVQAEAKRQAALADAITNQRAWIKHQGTTLYGYRHKHGPRAQRHYYADQRHLDRLITQAEQS
jgi:hypothetical protein